MIPVIPKKKNPTKGKIIGKVNGKPSLPTPVNPFKPKPIGKVPVKPGRPSPMPVKGLKPIKPPKDFIKSKPRPAPKPGVPTLLPVKIKPPKNRGGGREKIMPGFTEGSGKKVIKPSRGKVIPKNSKRILY